MHRLFKKLKENSIYIAAIVILLSILTATLTAFRNQAIMRKTEEQARASERAIQKTEELLRWLNLTDMGVRGYAIGRTKALLDPYTQAVRGIPLDTDTIRSIMQAQNYSTLAFEKYVEEMKVYLKFSQQMIDLADADDMDQFRALLIQDRGFSVWQTYQEFSVPFVAHQHKLADEAQESYTSAVRSNTIIQLILLLFGVPSLIVIIVRLRKNDTRMAGLLAHLEKNNRKYMFNPGTEIEQDAAKILEASIDNSRHASQFIKQITNGNFDVNWEGMTPENAPLNKENLSGTLIEMRDQMKQIQEEDRKRIWTTEGLTKLSELIRKHQDDAAALADHATRYLVRYLQAQQGAAFILEDDEEENQFLQLNACYAFDKKKFIEKRVDIGQGMIGQAFLEASTVKLRSVPNGYTHITSGLGDATPTCVLIVPMKYNEKVEGILELAGFIDWQEHEVNFAEKATEYMAAAIASVRATQKMKTLVEQMQSQTQQLHAQEEEMRQNMEELAATNEEMKRKETEYLDQLRRTGVLIDA